MAFSDGSIRRDAGATALAPSHWLDPRQRDRCHKIAPRKTRVHKSPPCADASPDTLLVGNRPALPADRAGERGATTRRPTTSRRPIRCLSSPPARTAPTSCVRAAGGWFRGGRRKCRRRRCSTPARDGRHVGRLQGCLRLDALPDPGRWLLRMDEVARPTAARTRGTSSCPATGRSRSPACGRTTRSSTSRAARSSPWRPASRCGRSTTASR